jgi:hypothetical protein
MICTFCGLETGRPSSHETQERCIEALRLDVSKLRDVLDHARRPGEPPRLHEPNPTAAGQENDQPR